MMMPATRRPPRLALPVQRMALLVRIHQARAETAEIVGYLAADLQATERTRRSIQSGWKVLKAAVVAAGVIWSFNASSRLGRGRRFVTLAISLLSTMRAMRRVSAFFGPLIQSSGRQG